LLHATRQLSVQDVQATQKLSFVSSEGVLHNRAKVRQIGVQMRAMHTLRLFQRDVLEVHFSCELGDLDIRCLFVLSACTLERSIKVPGHSLSSPAGGGPDFFSSGFGELVFLL